MSQDFKNYFYVFKANAGAASLPRKQALLFFNMVLFLLWNVLLIIETADGKLESGS